MAEEQDLIGSERADALHGHSAEEAAVWVGHKLDDIGGDTIGRVEEVLVEPESKRPSWLLVKIGRLGGHRTAVPFEFAAAAVDHVWVPYPRETIRAAPEVLPRDGLGPDLEQELRRHFGIPADGAADGASAEAGPAAEAEAEAQPELEDEPAG